MWRMCSTRIQCETRAQSSTSDPSHGIWCNGATRPVWPPSTWLLLCCALSHRYECWFSARRVVGVEWSAGRGVWLVFSRAGASARVSAAASETKRAAFHSEPIGNGRCRGGSWGYFTAVDWSKYSAGVKNMDHFIKISRHFSMSPTAISNPHWHP